MRRYQPDPSSSVSSTSSISRFSAAVPCPESVLWTPFQNFDDTSLYLTFVAADGRGTALCQDDPAIVLTNRHKISGPFASIAPASAFNLDCLRSRIGTDRTDSRQGAEPPIASAHLRPPPHLARAVPYQDLNQDPLSYLNLHIDFLWIMLHARACRTGGRQSRQWGSCDNTTAMSTMAVHNNSVDCQGSKPYENRKPATITRCAVFSRPFK